MTGDTLDEFPEALLPLLKNSDEAVRIEWTKELLDCVDKALKAHNCQLDEAMVHKALKSIFSEKEQTMIKSIFDKKEEIGESRGIVRGKIEAVLTVLRTRFQRVLAEVETAILQMTDPIALDSRTARAASCKSMDEFAKALQ